MSKRYEKIKTVGRGGFSTVYLVKDTQNGDKCVLKEMIVSQMSAAEQDMAKREVQVLRSFHHPYIIQYRDNFLHKGKLNIVMEYASGGDLYQRIRKQGSKHFPEATIRRWLAELLSALKEVHSRKMIHRDLKPQNIFLDSDGAVKMGDFGIVKDLAHTRAAHTQIGTPFYISPEICHNKAYDHKSDMWSLGCLLYEMCALKPPFMADDLKAMMKRICYSEPTPIPATYSGALKSLVEILLKKNPRERPGAAQVCQHPSVCNELQKLEAELRRPSPPGIDPPPLTEASRFDPDVASVGPSQSPTVASVPRMSREQAYSKRQADAAARIQGAFRQSMGRRRNPEGNAQPRGGGQPGYVRRHGGRARGGSTTR